MVEIVEQIKNNHPDTIWIDGKDGSGKSYLAKQLGEQLEISVVSVDDFLVRQQGTYVSSVKFEQLRDTINQARKPVIIEGVCLLKVRENLGIEGGLDIYVKRMSPMGYWADEDECDLKVAPDDFIQRQLETLERAASIEFMGIESNGEPIEFPQLARELIEYHYSYQPHKRSDITYCRIDE
ncbi:TPA: hypothetical protein PMB55_003663 [Vibrio cholerae]|uniref:hypothetical protein n=1 Tax=Vibrio TaxID=662 RepID=UPI000A1D5B9F|nr:MULTISPECIES: hypothetical protein [Vibrio]EGQ7704118.1 hypothetical protein [Vibrio cholerae]EGR0366635.1 hypothetical protein [Vibrio cholerae]EGR0730411.1 hypothetical protein [Vibrio cholerae]EGR0786658.1 hypothetical protein [Vibrio cholerae]EGR0836745.1 hypothetical protein [Vibrio cholerae]